MQLCQNVLAYFATAVSYTCKKLYIIGHLCQYFKAFLSSSLTLWTSNPQGSSAVSLFSLALYLLITSGAYLRSHPCSCSTQAASGFSCNIRLGCKGFSGTNTLAYLSGESLMTKRLIFKPNATIFLLLTIW
jgi:hypothetical protein